MQGTSLTKQERECKLYDEFDKFTYKKGESLHEYYLRFTLLLNDINIYKMPLEQFQVNTKFLNTLPDEWSKFVTDVKLVKDLHTTNVDQLHAYLQQHERHANEVHLMHERHSDPLALVASHQLPLSTYQSHLHTLPNSQLQHHVSYFCTMPREKGYDKGSMICVAGFMLKQSGQVLTEDGNSFFGDPGLPDTTNLFRLQELLHGESSRNGLSALTRGQSAQTVHMMTKSKICYDHSTKQAIGFEKPFYLKKVQESKPKLYDGNVILKMDAIVIPDSDETLMLCEESRSKMLLKEQDPMVVKHKVNTKPINYAILNNDYNKRFVRQSDLYSEHAYWKATSVPPLDPSPSSTTNKVEVPKELPKVSMVNTSLKELKRHLTGFDQVVKERTTATAITSRAT
ncbi:hypothetical protein Tco_0281985 [Tanacetum coccineum]